MNPVLCIIMRNDLPSMNAGKGMAQASHASNAFMTLVTARARTGTDISLVNEWAGQTNQGFGTVKVLEASKAEIELAFTAALRERLIAEYVFDPTYPYRVPDLEIYGLIASEHKTAQPILHSDGKVTAFRNEMTCAFVFGESEVLKAIPEIKELRLHP